MNKDIVYEQNNIVFNYRVAIVIRNNNKILIQKDNRCNYYILPGGRCKLGESSIDAAIREFKEETGINTKSTKSLGMIENFFTSNFNGKKYHEILIIHELEFINTNDYKSDYINNVEDDKNEFINFEWINVEDLYNIDLKPKIIIDIIKSNEYKHVINKD